MIDQFLERHLTNRGSSISGANASEVLVHFTTITINLVTNLHSFVQIAKKSFHYLLVFFILDNFWYFRLGPIELKAFVQQVLIVWNVISEN